MKPFLLLVLALLITNLSLAQDFNPVAVSFTPSNIVEFKMNLPIVHLNINSYMPSTRGVYAGQPVTFKLFNRNYPWTNTALFMRVRWDNDFDASNGVTWSNWFQDQNENAYSIQQKTYSVPGRYTITFEIEFFLSNGSQAYSRQKQYDIVVAPQPTNVYQDSHNNKLFYWVGNDGVLNKPGLLLEGFDPDNGTSPEENYMLGYDLIDVARNQGYDLFIMEWADGGADLAINKDVFLGACQFIHNKLSGLEAAVQVVGLSMGGTIARYGLAFAEDISWNNPGQYADHFVNTFISFDAPQQGAHFNSRLQEVIRDFGKPAQKAVLQSVAANQMLYNDIFDLGGSTHALFYDNNIKSLNNLNPEYGNTNGYPRRSKNYSVSNGNRNTNYPGYSTATPLATITTYENINISNIITLPVASQTFNINAEERDYWPGSTFSNDLRNLSTVGFVDIWEGRFAGIFVQAGGGWKFQVNFNPGYVPTESGIDLDGYTRSSDGSLVGGTSWFNDHLLQTTFRRHEELTEDSKNKVMEWLNNNRTYPYLGRPTNLSGAISSGNAIQIAFQDHAAFEDGFVVERKAEGGTYIQIGTAPHNSLSFTDTDPNLQPFTRYYYRIRSFSGSRFSGYSDEVAVYLQPHLAGSTSSALASNAQKKIVRTTSSSNNLFLVYESANGSYLTRYDEGSDTWSIEKPVGNYPTATMKYHSPSMYLDSSGITPLVIYQETNVSTGVHSLKHAIYDNGQGTLNIFPASIYQMSGLANFQAMPVAATTNYASGKSSLLTSAWRYDAGSAVAGIAFGVAAKLNNGDLGTWSVVDLNAGVFQGPVAYATNPAIACVLKTNSNPAAYHFYIAWEEENHNGILGGIRLVHGRYTVGQPWPPVASQIFWERDQAGATLGQIYSVAQNTSTETHKRPSLTLDGSGRVIIAWESSNSTTGKALVQKRDGLTSSSITAATTTVASGIGTSNFPHQVSITDYRFTSAKANDLAMVWHSDGGGTFGSWFNATANVWTTPVIIDAGGRMANIATTKSPTETNRPVVYTQVSGPPYALKTATLNAQSPPPSPVQLSVQTVYVNGIKRPQFSWSSAGENITYKLYRYNCPYPGGDCEAVPGVRATTTSTTFTDISVEVFTKTGTQLTPTNTYYYFVVAVDVFNQPSVPSNKVAVNTAEEPIYEKSGAITREGELQYPVETKLLENFPNPFNPVTTLRYQLSSPGFVSIKIFNTIGEEILTLAEGEHNAGYYDAIWDAQGKPSGLYYARVIITNQSGKTEYQTTKKLVLMK